MDFRSAEGDRIDLSAIDADMSKAGDQAFDSLSVRGAFSGTLASAGALYFDQTTMTLCANVDADLAADFSVRLVGVSSLDLEDFIL